MDRLLNLGVLIFTGLSVWFVYLSCATSMNQNQYFLYLAGSIQLLTGALYGLHMYHCYWVLDPIAVFIWIAYGAVSIRIATEL